MTAATTASGNLYFEYNDNGLRVSKTKNGVETTYYYDGTRLVSEKNENETIIYIYDDEGTVIGMQYRLTTYAEDTWDVYWFERNLQDDIVGVYDKSGTKLISYTYDAWGICKISYSNNGASTTAVNNPFRYRGYYYDSDLQLYYLQTRYYDNTTGRFISADSTDLLTATPNALTDKNLYAYCDNNPVMRTDRDGEFWVSMLVGAGIGVLGQLASDLITSAIDGELSFSHWSTYLGAAVGGAVGGVLSTFPVGEIVSDVVGSVVTTIVTSVSYNIESAVLKRDEYYSFEEISCTAYENVFISLGGSFMFQQSKLAKVIPDIKILGTNMGVHSIFTSCSMGWISGITNSKHFNWPNTHTWESPTPERWYPIS